MKRSLLPFAVAVAVTLGAQAARADFSGSAKPCSLPNGTYHIVLPEGAKGPVPAILLIRGYGGSGLGTIHT